MSSFALLTAPDCHLCQHGREVLDEVGIDWHEVCDDTPEGEALAATAPPMRPVLIADDGHAIAYGRLSAKRLRRQLDRAEAIA